MAIEAAALTGAMNVLRGRGILALPIHDSLIVPRSAVAHACGALDSSFSHFAKVRVRWTVDTGQPWPSSNSALPAHQEVL